MNTIFAIIVVTVTNIFIHKVCRDFINKLFVTKIFLAKRTLIFLSILIFVKAYKFVKIKSKRS